MISSTWTGKCCARLLHQASCLSTVDRACCCRSGRAIEPRPDDRFVDDGEVVTAAGVSAGIDMALHLVGRLGSPEKARDVRHYIQRVGATVLSELEETPFGDRHYRVEGPEGHRTLPDCSARSTRRIRSGTPGAGWIDVGHIASNRLYARPTSRAWFWVWALVGVGAALGAVSLGPLLLVPTAAVAALLLSKPTIRRSAYGLVSGVGAILLYIAYVQRAGPGTTCWHRRTASGCDQNLNPIPWLVLGIACLIGGVIGHVKQSG